jgi:LuxR family maltose regulon positive regulatory protein
VSSPLLTTKLYIPTTRQGNISRQKLIEQLNTGRESKLILLSAPAGYGKTTLLAEWVNQLDIPVGWISLDAQDNDLKCFFSYLFASLKSIDIQINENSIPDIKAQDSEKISGVISVLINQVSSSSKPVYLMLDDFHQIDNLQIHQTINYLLENLPQNMHLVIATRSDPLLRLAKLRAQADLFEIRADDLRFTLEETGQYFNNKMGLGLTLSDISTLLKKTEGWIVGIQLAGISLKNNPDKHQFVLSFAGDNRYIADYLLDEALSQQPNHVQDFLLKTSILDLLSAPLCNAVTGRKDSLAILSELENENLFLVPLDDKGNWYRYHHLFRDLLFKRLHQEPAETRFQLYQNASIWFEQNQLFSEAVRMSLLSGDSARVAKLMEGYLLTIVSTSELVKMNQLMKSLPASKISNDPWLALALAWGLAYEGELDHAYTLLEIASAGSKDSNEMRRDQLKGRILVLRAYLAGTKADYPQSIQFAQQALAEFPKDDLSIQSFTILIIGNAFRFQGETTKAIQFHQKALNLSKKARDTFLTVVILSRLVDIYRITGQVNLSLSTGLDALQLIEDLQNKIGVTTFVEGYLRLRLSSTYYELNKLDQALRCAETGLELARQWGAYDSQSVGYFNICQIYQVLGDPEKAERYIQEFIDKYPYESRYQCKMALAYKAELALRGEDIQSAASWVKSSGLQISDDIRFVQFKFYDVLAQVFIAEDKLEDAYLLLEKILRLTVDSGAVVHEIRTRGRMAMLLQKDRNESLALEMITLALDLAAEGGYVRTILDLGENIPHLLYAAAQNGIQVKYCSRLLEGLQPQKQVKFPDNQPLVEPLSSREKEVLELIALGYTNQEIAEQLYLSVYTIKSHARNVFGKLGVKNRTEAVARARLYGLLPKD